MPVRFIIRRLLWMVPVLFTIALITFVLMHNTPGGPWDRDKPLAPQVVANLNRKYGLDQSLPRQFVTYLWNAARGDLGPSYQYRDKSVNTIIAQQLPYSAQLGFQALLLALLIAIPLGVVASLYQNTWVDYVGIFFATLGVTVPSFVIGILFVVLFGVQFRWVPVITQSWSIGAAWWLSAIVLAVIALAFVVGAGVDTLRRQVAPTISPWIPGLATFGLTALLVVLIAGSLHRIPAVKSTWTHVLPWILPTVVLALGPAAFLARLTRATMLEAIRQDYVRTAYAKGLADRVVIGRHVVKNAMLPIITVLGPATAALITGSFFVETIFSVPGIGRLSISAVSQRDYPVLMGTTLLYAVVIAVANLIVDLAYGFIDPRIKVEG